MRDINGREVTIKAERGYHGYGTQPFSITAETRQGRKGFRATWMPSGSSARFATKREATAFIKAHERIAYGR